MHLDAEERLDRHLAGVFVIVCLILLAGAVKFFFFP